MDLSNDLISKFVKITNDADKQKSKEGTVYGTAVKYDGGMYVKIDGSDLLTPVDTTADIQDNERVTITIKDHNATVTGNITSPSANEGTVTNKVTEAVDGIEDKVMTNVEVLVDGVTSTVSKTYQTKSDMDNYPTTTQMNSAINQKADSITLTVSETYQTKSDMDNYPTTTQMNSAISQKADSITSTVSKTYQTKSDMNNYPTTTQMNSAINQKADSITSTVSKTYTTKSELNSETSALESSISTVSQTANKVSWIIKSGTSSTNMTLTDKVYSLVSSNISLSADKIDLHGYVTANENFKIDTSGNMTAKNGTFSGTINGGSIDINGKFKVSTSGALTTESTIAANGGIYTYQDIRGLDDTYGTGGLTLVSGTGHVCLRSEAPAHSVYIQPASGEAYITYPSSSDLADLRLKNLFCDQTNGTYGNFGSLQLYATNPYLEVMYGYGVIRVVDRNHLYLQTGGDTGGDTSAEIRCTRYKDATNYVNIRAHNVCAENAVYANGVNVSSDRARKRDIELYSTDALHEVCTTPVYTYHLDTDKDEELKRIGIIMQEAPLDAIDLTGKGVDLYQMVTMLWRAVQQQQEMIKELKGE